MSGPSADPLLDEIVGANDVFLVDDLGLDHKRYVRCEGAAYGCPAKWVAPQALSRIIKHAAACQKIDNIGDSTLWAHTYTKMKEKSLGDRTEMNPEHKLPGSNSKILCQMRVKICWQDSFWGCLPCGRVLMSKFKAYLIFEHQKDNNRASECDITNGVFQTSLLLTELPGCQYGLHWWDLCCWKVWNGPSSIFGYWSSNHEAHNMPWVISFNCFNGLPVLPRSNHHNLSSHQWGWLTLSSRRSDLAGSQFSVQSANQRGSRWCVPYGFYVGPKYVTLLIKLLILIRHTLDYRHSNIIRELNPLKLAKIKIPAKKNGTGLSCSNPAKDSELPSTVKQMANYLLRMLHTEYVNKKATIADLDIATANSRLKKQALKYIKGAYPFDHDLCEGETAIEW